MQSRRPGITRQARASLSREMAPRIDVPLNTLLADLDESLRALLRRELEPHGFGGVNVAFEAPARSWSATLSAPTINLFLYDLREATKRRSATWAEQQQDAHRRSVRPPLRLEVSYAVTAWTRTVEDEHRLLSQVLGILYAYPVVPGDVLSGTLGNGSQDAPLEARVGQRSEGRPDFWGSIGGDYKASVDYSVLVSCPSGTALERGPAVRTRTVRTRRLDAPGQPPEVRHRCSGTVVGPDGEPVADAWVALPQAGRFTTTDSRGAFAFDRIPDGDHPCLVRTGAGHEAEGRLRAPGPALELRVGTRRRKG
jgi:hypothetical protein